MAKAQVVLVERGLAADVALELEFDVDNYGTPGERTLDRLTAGEAELAETSLVMGKSGQRSKVESIREVRYPSEFDSDKSGLPVPTAFELKNQGTTSEVDPVIAVSYTHLTLPTNREV